MKSQTALSQLGQDIRGARLRRGFTVFDLADRADTSTSTVTRLEAGAPGVAIGTLADILVVLGLVDHLAGALSFQKDDLGVALAAERTPKRGRSYGARLRGQSRSKEASAELDKAIDPDGVAF